MRDALSRKRFVLTWLLAAIISYCHAQEADTIENEVTVVPPESTEFFERENKFDPITHDSVFADVRAVPDSIIKRLQADDAFWYANETFKEAEVPVNRKYRQPLTSKSWFKNLMWGIIIIAFIAAVIWYLSASNFRFFSRKSEKVKFSDEDIETEDIFGIQYEREIAKAEHAKNFRLAIRLRFLQLLKTLSEKNIIRYQQDRTNFDYLTQLSGSTYYRDFFRLVRNYEYAWYGKMDPGPEGYAIIRDEFSHINSRLA